MARHVVLVQKWRFDSSLPSDASAVSHGRPERPSRVRSGPMAEPFTVLIMAAGQGTRMRSELPKVLHRVCGKPMLDWVVDAGREAGADRIVCVVRPGDGVAEGLPEGVELAEQTEGEGTGSAVLAARSVLESAGGPVVVLSGDHPLVSAEHLTGLLGAHRDDGAAATILTTDKLDPAGYGRIVRNGDGGVERIVETKYPEGVPEEELAIREINLGTYAFEPVALLAALDTVDARAASAISRPRSRSSASGDQGIVTYLTDDAARRARRERPRRPDAGRGGGTGPHPRAPGPRRRDLPPARHHPRRGRRRDRRGHGDRPRREPAGLDQRGREAAEVGPAGDGHRLPHRRAARASSTRIWWRRRWASARPWALRLPQAGHRARRGRRRSARSWR